MTDYAAITEAETNPEAPSTSSLWKRWWKNPLAMFEGAAGAPRLQNAAIGTAVIGAEKFQSGAAESAWVLDMVAQVESGAIGHYKFLARTSGGSISAGTVYAGSGLFNAGVAISSALESTARLSYTTGAQSGSWMACGSVVPAQGGIPATLFLRVA